MPADRPSPPRSSGKQRSRHSPPPDSSSSAPPAEQSEGRPPAKRARKAINCEPCRNSKLKCDRNRPCSSCVLRGTSALCYQDGRGFDGPRQVRGDEGPRIDPLQEIVRARQAIANLEAHIFPNVRQSGGGSNGSYVHRPGSPSPTHIKTEGDTDQKPPPGWIGGKDQGGLYTGSTSAAAHLMGEEGSDRQPSSDEGTDPSSMPRDYDRDLIHHLPELAVIDELINFYFEYCNWVYRHINEPAFRSAWARFKAGHSTDRLILATACAIMATAVHYLRPDHPIFANGGDHETIGDEFYNIMFQALQRYQQESRAYSLELIELLLLRCHYLTLAKKESEEVWTGRGELVTIGIAMGLHRDPSRSKLPLLIKERRRWAWWHIILLERWQAFMFGRPTAIPSHCFDTELPSHCDRAVDPTGRLYLPNIALFRVAYILGDIMPDAVSLRPVPFESILKHDRDLAEWEQCLPPELNLDQFNIARSLSSPDIATRRLGVQSVIIRTSYYHIRFSLHRPYASASVRNGRTETSPRVAQSLDTAVRCADKLITMVGHSMPESFGNAEHAVPGHLNWGPFHVFSAAMFFSFQLIASPDQPGASLFRANIRKAMATLEQGRQGNLPLADKALNILTELAPLYSAEFPLKPPRERENMKASVLANVKRLAFPYHDSRLPRTAISSDSPTARQLASPSGSGNFSPGVRQQNPNGSPLNLQAQPLDPSMGLGMRSERARSDSQSLSVYASHPPQLPPVETQHLPAPGQSHSHPQQISPVHTQSELTSLSPSTSSIPPQQGFHAPQLPPATQQNVYGDTSRYQSYPLDEDNTHFGAATGMGMGEWAWFKDFSTGNR